MQNVADRKVRLSVHRGEAVTDEGRAVREDDWAPQGVRARRLMFCEHPQPVEWREPLARDAAPCVGVQAVRPYVRALLKDWLEVWIAEYFAHGPVWAQSDGYIDLLAASRILCDERQD